MLVNASKWCLTHTRATVRGVDLFCACAFASAALDTAIITKASLSSIIHRVCVAPLRAGVHGGRAAAGGGWGGGWGGGGGGEIGGNGIISHIEVTGVKGKIIVAQGGEGNTSSVWTFFFFFNNAGLKYRRSQSHAGSEKLAFWFSFYINIQHNQTTLYDKLFHACHCH